MGYAERNTWSQLVASTAGAIVYLALVLPQMLSRPIADVEWQWPMVWTVLGAIVLAIVLAIGWGIVAGMIDPDEEHREDQRDREIEHLGDRVGQAFLVIGALAALVLAMIHADWFWIGNALFFGFYLSALLGGVTRLIVYRRGMP